MSAHIATWFLSLETECPACNKDIDLTDSLDFWCNNPVQPLEIGTAKSKDFPATCPECGHEFTVDLEY